MEHSENRNCVDLQFFKTFFEPARFDLVEYIFLNPKKSINEIAGAFTQDRSVISRHLEQLFKHNILIKEKISRYTYYSINTDIVTERFEYFTAFLQQLKNRK